MSTTGEPRIPGPDHPITIEPFNGHVTVTSGGRVITDSTAALELREASYPPVYYVPLADVDQAALRPTDTTTHCPYKGNASHYDVIDAGALGVVADAVWHYREPYPFVSELADYVAFYTDRVEVAAEPAT